MALNDYHFGIVIVIVISVVEADSLMPPRILMNVLVLCEYSSL